MRISDWSSDVCSSDLKKIGIGDPAAAALIGAARIDKTIAQDPGAARQSRADRARDMVGARGGEEQGFASRIPAVVAAFHQKRPDRLGAGAAAGLARRDDIDSACFEGHGKRANLCRLADTLAALQRDETAARQDRKSTRLNSSH